MPAGHRLISLSVLTAIFPGWPVFIEAKDDRGGGDNWTTGATSRAKLQSNHHHQQTNIQFFTDQMPFLSPKKQCKALKGRKNSKIQGKLLNKCGMCQILQ